MLCSFFVWDLSLGYERIRHNFYLSLERFVLVIPSLPLTVEYDSLNLSHQLSHPGLQNSSTAPPQRDKTPGNECPWYDTKQSEGEVSIVELWEVRSTSSLPLAPCPLWPRVVATDRVLSMATIELFEISTVCKNMTCSIEL